MCLIFVEPVHRGAGWADLFGAPERSAEYHPNRDTDAQPHRNMPGQDAGNCAECRSQRNA
jgi:hypothetical protein